MSISNILRKTIACSFLSWAMTGAHTAEAQADKSDQPTDRPVCISNEVLQVEFNKESGRFAVRDLRSGRRWTPAPLSEEIQISRVEVLPHGVAFQFVDPANQLTVEGQLQLEVDRPEVVLTLSAEGPMPEKIYYPVPFETAENDLLILPLNEGISYPVDEASIEPMNFILFGGHGLCMPWYGVTDGEQGWMAIVETPDDAGVDMIRRKGRLELQPEWYSQKGRFGYNRVIRFVFFDKGGYVAMAKRYRQYAKDTGLFKTLAEKRKERPEVDKLIGAANIWFSWDDIESGPDVVREMKAKGLDRILWSAGGRNDELKELNQLGALTSCYDIYQDAMNPKYFPRLEHINRRWVTEAWENDDIILDEQGRHYTSWRVEAKDGERIACGVVCDSQILPYARERISAELEERPFLARFVDTTTAARWRECWHRDHPMTRSECKAYRMELHRYVSEEVGIVLGAEAGHDAAVPYTDYFEGMLSLWPYRVPDSGHKPTKVYHEVPESVAKFQTGHYYRLPLWELVYHDCAVSHWYWGDYNNKLPALWDRRDLFNVLYGTPPLMRFGKEEWEEQQDRIVQSYQTTVPVATATGYSEMLSHEWLTDDHAVQRTTFANGVTVTVNFGDQIHYGLDGIELAPLGYSGEGIKEEIESNNYPPNPLEKAGWVLTAHDEFDGPELIADLWVSDYLGSITTPDRSKPRYELRNGHLVLKIERDQLPFWADKKTMKASGIQTGQRPRLRAHFKDVRDIPTEMKFTQQYGYFEIRTKTYVAEGYHCAFWTVGVHDEHWQDGEIDIIEQYRKPGQDMFNLHPWKDHHLKDTSKKHKLDFDPTAGFNIYALEWDEKFIKKYVNNKLVATIDQSPQYPAVFILSIYENAGWNGVADTSEESGYPKEFVIDYFRAYARAEEP